RLHGASVRSAPASVLSRCCPPPPDLPSFPTRRSSDLFWPRDRHRLDGGRRLPQAPAPVPAARALPGRDCGAVASWSQRARFGRTDRKSTRLNSSHVKISYAVFCLKKKKGSGRRLSRDG